MLILIVVAFVAFVAFVIFVVVHSYDVMGIIKDEGFIAVIAIIISVRVVGLVVVIVVAVYIILDSISVCKNETAASSTPACKRVHAVNYLGGHREHGPAVAV